jgi:hypothetical protein
MIQDIGELFEVGKELFIFVSDERSNGISAARTHRRLVLGRDGSAVLKVLQEFPFRPAPALLPEGMSHAEVDQDGDGEPPPPHRAAHCCPSSTKPEATRIATGRLRYSTPVQLVGQIGVATRLRDATIIADLDASALCWREHGREGVRRHQPGPPCSA